MSILVLLTIIVFFSSFIVGRYSVPLDQLLHIFYAKLFHLPQTWPDITETVVFNVRFPRIVAAMIVGAVLAVAGSAYQGLFRNPMVSPDILGASAGAGFGAAIGILYSFHTIGIQLSSFLFGLGAVALTYLLSHFVDSKENEVLILVITGMVVSTLFSSFISIIKYVADPYSKLPAVTFWLMGGLGSITNKDLLFVSIPIFIGVVPLLLLRWKLNILSFGEEEAKSLGINTTLIRIIIITCSTLITAAAVSISGIIGWIGLIIPHLTRLIVGPNYKVLLPACLLIGSSFLLLVDNIARSLFSMEIPLGIVTSIIGAPFFILILINGKKKIL